MDDVSEAGLSLMQPGALAHGRVVDRAVDGGLRRIEQVSGDIEKAAKGPWKAVIRRTRHSVSGQQHEVPMVWIGRSEQKNEMWRREGQSRSCHLAFVRRAGHEDLIEERWHRGLGVEGDGGEGGGGDV